MEEDGKLIERVYGQAGQLIRYTDTTGYTIQYACDGGGWLSTFTYPDDKQVSYRYDKAGRRTGRAA